MENKKTNFNVNDTPISIVKRFKAIAIDSFIMIVISVLLVILSMEVISNTSKFKTYNEILEQEMLECYRIEEEAKIYEFIGGGDSKYQSPRKQEEIFVLIVQIPLKATK